MSIEFSDPKSRFSSRAKYYAKYRPGYPKEILTLLKQKEILQTDTIIADIGSGTGILSELFLQEKNHVLGIEPNPKMRIAAETYLSKYSTFRSICGSAENTTLKSQSVNLITVGQAFHWFQIEQTIKEFKRILTHHGNVVLIWNFRKTDGSNFNELYENVMLTHGTDYAQLKKPFNLKSLLPTNTNEYYHFKNQQLLDYQGYIGRTLSSSYIPLQNDPGFSPMITKLKQIFDENQIQGKITFEYDTKMVISQF